MIEKQKQLKDSFEKKKEIEKQALLNRFEARLFDAE